MFIINSVLNSVTYIVKPSDESRACWLVDCGDVDSLLQGDLEVKGVFLTHAHFDHIYGLNKLVERFPQVVVYTNMDGFKALTDPRRNLSRYHEEYADFRFEYLENVKLLDQENSVIPGTGMDVRYVFTPGHDSSCISYIINHALYTGDSFIPGQKVVDTFPRSDKKDAEQSYSLLLNLSREGYVINPGHHVISKESFK